MKHVLFSYKTIRVPVRQGYSQGEDSVTCVSQIKFFSNIFNYNLHFWGLKLEFLQQCILILLLFGLSFHLEISIDHASELIGLGPC